MAIWTPYRVTFKLLSPMHIGWRKTSNLQQTRPYVTGKTLWGALTACLVRETEGNDYKNMGIQVDEQLSYTYFFPSTKKDNVTLYSWHSSWDDHSSLEDFSWKYLGSYVSTALQEGRGAEEGSLHETEFIAPLTRDNEPVFLVGYIFEKDGCTLQWKDILDRLQLGGERGYGWGRVKSSIVQQKIDDQIFGLSLRKDAVENRPALEIPVGEKLLAHTLADNLQCQGTIEPFVGRETDPKTANFGKCCSKAQICWSPGSKVNDNILVKINEKGLWQRVIN